MEEELCVQLVPLFDQLSLPNQKQVEQLVHRYHADKNTIITRPNDENNLIIVESGKLKLYQLTDNGNEQVQQVLNTGDYIGENWLLGIENLNNYVETIDASKLCIINRQDFIRLLNNHTEIAIKLLERQAAKINQLQRQSRILGLPNIEERLLAYLKQLMKEQKSHIVYLPLKLKDLATYLGTTPETLSRKLLQLEQAGKISRKLRKIHVIKEI